MEETEEQKKDHERLKRYVSREQLVSVMSNTKWEKLRSLLLSHLAFRPLWREQYLRSDSIGDYRGNLEWTVGSPDYRTLEWVEIDPIEREHRGMLVGESDIDHTAEIVALLKNNHIPFSLENQYIRIWGYQRPGITINFA